MAQSIHAAHSPSPQVFCHCFFFLEQLQLPSGGSAGSHKKKKTVRLKEVGICLTLGQYQKKIPVLHFPINVSWKCHIQHLTIHQWLNHEYFQYLYNSKSTFNIIYFAITHSYHIWKLLKKIKLAMCLWTTIRLFFNQLYQLWDHGKPLT